MSNGTEKSWQIELRDELFQNKKVILFANSENGSLYHNHQTIHIQRRIAMTTLVNIETEPQAHIIRDDQEAIAIAKELAAEFVKEDSIRDRERRLPVEEVKKFSQSGLWGIIVPKEYGGAGVSNATLAEVIKIIAEADSSLGQIPQNHLYMVEAIKLDGTEEQKRFFFDLVLQGKRFGNAFSEIGTKSVTDVQTKLTRSGDGFVLNGRKYYSAG
jgi:alkylation response protein AidB-like acyl-CoA dehydrogenase